ncbi:rhodanese-like domain-containing protein [Haladaptatus salinisoli]|uniref:rhodanese-like domain-containing protein n=1 Tax=Haladaptatus salinisoli TaxID=2884876 RepID=UPI001D0B4D62|nr:rhodanese-like domain-containing protein [Haladaptatus salinisoli]
MNRRRFLAAGAVSVAGLSGCLGLGGGPGSKSEEGFETVSQYGQQVPLAPLSVTHKWYKQDKARFVDARTERQYVISHIRGAVLSPAPNGQKKNDPVASWPKDQRIVCYCGCPHHLSSMRAGKLLQNGYENVYVIDEGYWAWHEKGYPVKGRNTEATPNSYVIEGVTDPTFVGETAWARHIASGQNEATGIQNDGSYSMHLKFYDVTPDSVITVQTPEYEVEGTIAELSSRVVTG